MNALRETSIFWTFSNPAPGFPLQMVRLLRLLSCTLREVKVLDEVEQEHMDRCISSDNAMCEYLPYEKTINANRTPGTRARRSAQPANRT